MQKTTIKDLAKHIIRAKQEGNAPIFFLGAGVSASANIPLASGLVDYIFTKYDNYPEIDQLIQNNRRDYAEVMSKLLPSDRNKLFKSVIADAKINIAHIYLAQLMITEYVDYVLTVNFDNLLLRALALYHIFPPIYDIAILNELTTSNFEKRSVFYLHGQHHGIWLLNTELEMKRVASIVPKIRS